MPRVSALHENSHDANRIKRFHAVSQETRNIETLLFFITDIKALLELCQVGVVKLE